MIEHYGELRLLHITAVVVSVSLFFLRGVAVQAGASIAMAPMVRYVSYAVDTVLLLAALALIWVLRDVVMTSTWLWVKVALLPLYIVLGSFALKRARSKPMKLLFLLAALGTVFWMVRIAVTHDPLGGLGLYLGD